MKKLILISLLLALMAVTAQAAVKFTLTVADTAVGIPSWITSSFSPNKCLLTYEGAGIRMWLDGTAPTSSVGHSLSSSNFPLTLDNKSEVDGFKAIRSSTTGTITGTCW